jgi:hypothetical protein
MSRGWHRFSGGNDLPFGVGKPAAFATALAAWLQRPGVVPVRLDDASCGSGTCYQLRLDVSSTELAPILAAASGLGGGLAASSAQVVLLVDRATLDLSDVTLAIDLGATGKVTAAMRFSRWNADVTIPLPPANEIVENA